MTYHRIAAFLVAMVVVSACDDESSQERGRRLAAKTCVVWFTLSQKPNMAESAAAMAKHANAAADADGTWSKLASAAETVNRITAIEEKRPVPSSTHDDELREASRVMADECVRLQPMPSDFPGRTAG